MVSNTQLKRFAELFTGYHKAYGQYDIKKTAEKGSKSLGKPWTVGQGVDAVAWRKHLDGTGPGLGIIMLQADNTCRFGAIDVDDYTVDHTQLHRRVEKLKLPLVVCRTKSGGAHLYCFFEEDVPAAIVRDRLGEWCAALGLSAKTEQFPKQIARANELETGNWINIPFQNAERTMRYAVNDLGPLNLDQFLDYAESRKVGLAYMEKVMFGVHSEQDLFFEGPPCLVTLHSQGGFPEGTRNEGMFAVGVYCRKRFGDNWEERIDEYNREMANLPSTEIAGLIRSVGKKDYSYPCKRSPINAVCQRRQCLGREYGVGDAGTASAKVEILSVIRYDHPAPDPPVWSFEINGRRVMVDNDTFYSRDALNRACMAQAGCVPLHMPPARWLKQLNELVQSADVVPMPEDASPTGQLWERIEMFLQQGVNALQREEILTGKVFREHGYCYFRSVDLFAYLDNRRIKYKTEQMVWQLLREHGGDKRVFEFGTKPHSQSANIWIMPYVPHVLDQGNVQPSFGVMSEF